MLKYYSILFFILAILHGKAQERFFHFNKENGLNNNDIEYIYQDSYGYMWIGTFGGLSKFDGYSFKNYTIYDSINYITSNSVFAVFEDSHKNLWVGLSKEMMLYNRAIDKFEILPNIEKACITGITQSNDSTLWVTSYNGLYKININTKSEIKKYTLTEGLPSDKLVSIVIDKNGIIWIGSQDKGVFSIDPVSEKVKVFNTSTCDPNNCISGNQITTLTLQGSNILWIGTSNSGISKYNIATGEFTNYKNKKQENVNLGVEMITYIYIDSKENIWACRNGYLNKYDTVSNNFIRNIPHNLSDEYIKNNQVSKVFEDIYGNLWIGSYGKGIEVIKKPNQNFHTYSKENHNLVFFENIRAITPYEDKLLLGSDGYGILIYDPQNDSIYPYRYNERLTSKQLMSICQYKDELWCCTWGGGINKLNLKTNTVEQIDIKDSTGKSLNILNIRFISIIDDIAWIGTSGQGLYFYDINNHIFRDNLYKDTVNFKNKSGWITSIKEDSKKRVWVTTMYGVYLFTNGYISGFYSDTKKANTLSNNVVFSAYEDNSGDIWFATNNGISIYSDNTGTFKNLIPSDQFPALPKAFLQDNNNNIWISSETGIYQYNAEQNIQNRFDVESGILNTTYEINSAYIDSSNNIYFGGENGFIKFNPNNFIIDSTLPKIVLQELYINYKKQRAGSDILPHSMDNTDTLTLKYSKSVVSIEIGNINNLQIPKTKFSYFIEGYTKQWITLDNSRKITFSNIDPGFYKVLVKSCYNNICNYKTIYLQITPPWWNTIWFKLSTVLIVLMIIYGIYLNRVRLIRNQNRLLKKKVEEKTSELQQTNKQLQEKNIKLKEEEFLLQIKNDELEHSNSTKDKLFSIIAHDLKNPLSVVMGFAEILYNNNIFEGKPKKHIEAIYKSSKNIYAQIETLLNWSRSQTKSLKCNPEQICISSLINDNITLFENLIASKEIQLDYVQKHTHNALADRDMINIVFRNILSNAIKFTPQSGNITISSHNSPEYTIFEIKDSGKGMIQEQINNIFTDSVLSSKPGTNNEKGTGLGLIICRDFLNINNSTLEIDSDSSGCTFKVSLPKGNTTNLDIDNNTANEIDSFDLPDDVKTEDIESKPLLLIIDDNKDILNYIVNIFSSQYKVETACDGNEGFEKALKLVPDLIITDIMMPNRNGLQMCIDIKTDKVLNHIPIIILSAKNEFDLQLKSIEIGAFDFIPKPFNKQMLFLKVRSVLMSREKFKNHLKKEFVNQPSAEINKTPENTFMSTVNKILENKFTDPNFGVEAFASEMGYSRSQLFRKLKATIDTSPVEYLKIYRLKKAKEMIDTTSKRVSEIAYDVGFNDPQYFSVCFKSYFGAAPNIFLKNK